MPNRLLLLLPCALLAFFSGCGQPKPTLNLYIWADYIDPDLVREFEQAQGCRVVMDTFDSNESMYAKLKAGATGYDLIVPSSYMARVLYDEKLIRDIDHAQIPNLVHVDRLYLTAKAFDKAMTYSVPYMLGTSGIAAIGDQVSDFKPSWSMFLRSDLAGRMTMLNDMRETLGAALLTLGYSINSTDDAQIRQAGDLVIQWKRNLAKFENEQYKGGLASGEFLLVHGYSGDILQAREENENIVYALPEEGFSLACDDFVIPLSAQDVALAHAFINFLHDPANAARNTTFVYYLCPNTPSYELLDEEVKSDPTVFITPASLKKGEIIRDLGPDNAKYITVWDSVKAAP